MTVVQVTFGVVALVCIGLRTYCRMSITKQMGADDWTMLSSGIVLAAVFALNFHSESLHKVLSTRIIYNPSPFLKAYTFMSFQICTTMASVCTIGI